MIEKFTVEELNIIRKELNELEAHGTPQKKPHYLYREKMRQLFSDRPESEKIAEKVLLTISKTTDITLDCTRISNRHGNVAISSQNYVPEDIYDEYFEMYGEIVSVIEKHIKPYEKFKHN